MECNYCHEKFNRREHLERHLRRHSGARPFACPLCSRSFSRQDTLSRHIVTHGDDARGVLARTRGSRACQACSKDKVKCSGGNPCVRCQQRGRSCVERSRNRASNTRSSLSSNRQSRTRGSDSDVPTGLASDAVQVSSPVTQLPSDPPNFRLSAESPSDPQVDHTAFTAIDNVSLTGLDMCADFPWTLDHAYLLPEGFLGVGHSWAESTPQLDYFPFHSVSNAHFPQSSSLNTPHPQTSAGTEEPSTLLRGPSTPSQQRQQRQGRLETPNSSHPLVAQPTDDDITAAENFCHVTTQLDHAYQDILTFYAQQTDRRFQTLPFPPISIFNSFIQLYYEYFDDQLPFIHPSLLEQNDTPWILALAVASVGCQYTKLSKRCQYASTLTELLRLSLPIDALQTRGYDTMILAQSTLLLVINLMFTGFKDNVVNLQAYRAWLATLMRRFVISSTNKDSLLSAEMNSLQSKGQWQSWIRCESRKRLAYCFAMIDCFCFIFLGIEPYFSAREYEQRLPSSDILWKARTEDQWRGSLDSLNHQSESMSLDQVFSTDWASSDVLQHLSDFNKLILLAMLFVEESRVINASQSSALLNFDLEDQGASSIRPSPLSYRRLDWKYRLLAPKEFSMSTSTGNTDPRSTFHHLLGILRHVPRKQLYMYSGCYASQEDMSAAESFLFSWMRDNPALSRECVAHAGALIGEIRSTATTACYHYFCLLIATSYLWAFARFQNGIDASDEAFPPHPPATVLKIDQHHDPSLRDRWVQSGTGVLVHVTGVGLLSSPGSAERLWKEFLQIVGSRTGWPTLREGIMRCTCALLNHSSPMKGVTYSNSEVT